MPDLWLKLLGSWPFQQLLFHWLTVRSTTTPALTSMSTFRWTGDFRGHGRKKPIGTMRFTWDAGQICQEPLSFITMTYGSVIGAYWL
jgi:hypothetical protein